MKDTNQLINNALKNPTAQHSTLPRIFSEAERAAVNYFFAMIKLIYPDGYTFNVAPTPERERLTKKLNAPMLCGYTTTQIDKGIEFIREQKRNGESKYLKLDIDLCVGAVRDANRVRAIHREFERIEQTRLSKPERLAMLQKLKQENDL